jgi:hypothetical protein
MAEDSLYVKRTASAGCATGAFALSLLIFIRASPTLLD